MAIGASFGAHALVGLWLWLSPPPPPRPPPAAALTWMESAAVPTPPPLQPAVERAPTPPVDATVTPKKKKTARPETSAGVVTPGVGPSPLTADVPRAESGSGPALPAEPGRRPSLTPGLGFVMRLPEAADAEDTRGTTLRNDPRDVPDRQAVAEYEAERAGRKLSADLATDLARVQAASGRLPGFFSSIRRSMEDAAERAQVKVSKDSSRRALLDGVGSVLDPTRSRPSDEAIRRVAETASVQNARVGNPALPGDQQQFNQAVAQGFARFEGIKESLSAPQLRTVVALTTDARGVLAEATVVERSGDLTFDESALHLSRKVMRSLPDSDDMALGTSWWRSRWVFTWEPPRMRVRLLDATPLSPPLLQ